MATLGPVILFTFFILFGQGHAAQQYLGKFLGKLSELHHGVSGEVYAVDARTLHLKDFTYDGEGPAAYFWAGSTRTPGAAGFRVRDENGSGAVLKRYRRKSITLTLPEGKTLNNIKWFSVWCEEFAVNFGDVKIPRGFDYPKPQKVDGLHGVHGVSSDNIVIVDAQTLLIPNFSYDGEAPDAKFWVGQGTKPSPQGIRIPDENGKEIPLRRYDHKTVVLTLPGDLTVFDLGHFGVWCEAFTVDFGHVRIPQQMNVPPSLKMLGVSPQKRPRALSLLGELPPVLASSPPLSGAGSQQQSHLEATTYRPSSPYIQQQPQQTVYITQQHQSIPLQLNEQQQYQQQLYQNQQQQLYQNQQQQLYQNQQQLYNQQKLQLYNAQLQQQQQQQQIAQQRIDNYLAEQQLREQLSRVYNRFHIQTQN